MVTRVFRLVVGLLHRHAWQYDDDPRVYGTRRRCDGCHRRERLKADAGGWTAGTWEPEK